MFQNYPPIKQSIGLSFGIEKAILEQIQTEITQEEFIKAVLSSYSLVYPVELVTQLESELINRVLTRIEELQSPKENVKQNKTKKSFGTSFADWLAKLTATQSCLYLADYDVQKALHYYWKEDYLIVQEAIKVKSEHDSQKSLIQLEASMYGFGGKYQDDAGNDPDVIDLTQTNPDDVRAMMKSMGF